MECSLVKSSAPLSVRKQSLTFSFILILQMPRSVSFSKCCYSDTVWLIRDMVMGRLICIAVTWMLASGQR